MFVVSGKISFELHIARIFWEKGKIKELQAKKNRFSLESKANLEVKSRIILF